MNDYNDNEGDDRFDRLYRVEKNYHLVKTFLIILSTIVIVGTQVYTYDRLWENSDSNRQLLRCTDTVLITPNQTPESFRNQLNKCLGDTK